MAGILSIESVGLGSTENSLETVVVCSRQAGSTQNTASAKSSFPWVLFMDFLLPSLIQTILTDSGKAILRVDENQAVASRVEQKRSSRTGHPGIRETEMRIVAIQVILVKLAVGRAIIYRRDSRTALRLISKGGGVPRKIDKRLHRASRRGSDIPDTGGVSTKQKPPSVRRIISRARCVLDIRVIFRE